MTRSTDSSEPALLQDKLPLQQATEPTPVRYWVISAMTMAAFLMYLDRLCMSQIVNTGSFKLEFGFDKGTSANVLGAFFAAYALGQLPAGWLADRFGSRALMTCYIAAWSVFTLLTGFAAGFWTLIFFRIGCGMAEAGAYPASSKLVSRWIPLRSRGWASSLVAGGGRLGGATAPMLTGFLILSFGNWRVAGWVFGAVGIFFAIAFWWLVRDRPADHPSVNPAEQELIVRGLPPEQGLAPRTTKKFPFMGLIRSRSMWFMCANQFFSNLGWAFLATLMPTFLKEAKGLSEADSAQGATIALTIGISGMFMGGWLTDLLTRRLGTIRGRIIPLAFPRFIGAAAYLVCLGPVPPGVCVAAFAVVAMTADIAVPPTWAYCQDVGGRNVAACLAWPNMWGNLGAAITASLLEWVNENFDANHDWHESLMVSAAALVVCGLTAFGVRADRKIEGTGGDDEQPRGFPVVVPPLASPAPTAEG